MPSPSPISALTVQPARSTVGAALRPLPGFGVNRDFFFLVVSQYPVSIDSYPIKHRGHAGLSLGLMSPLFDGEPSFSEPNPAPARLIMLHSNWANHRSPRSDWPRQLLKKVGEILEVRAPFLLGVIDVIAVPSLTRFFGTRLLHFGACAAAKACHEE